MATKNPSSTTAPTAPPAETDATPRPPDLRPQDLQAAATAAGAPTAEPRMHPPGSPGAALQADGIAGWQSDRRVGALWCSNHQRNVFAWIDTVGWRKLAPTSDASVLAMTELACLGKDAGFRVDYREEADGAIHEIVVW